ncbi:alginate lyase family protein [candidate division KSB1 bacterium]|nr:alginate lyase family protein [candidate division KSB1 bacterium]
MKKDFESGHFFTFSHLFKSLNVFDQYFSYEKRNIVKSADQICTHTFNFLGTGPINWGDPINWHNDIKTNHKWSKKFYTDYKQKELIPSDGVDIKIPWELSRFHHLVTLAQAWRLTNEKKYSLEFFSQWESWRESNPFCYGVNWTNTMEVAIRAINLIVAVDLLGGAPGWDVNRGNILKSIRQHGLYIGHNLEIGVFKGQIIAGNHYLANICGMAVIGMSCQGLPEASRWVKTGIKALEQEMKGMVLDDGFFFESSTSYHRLAIELFLFPVIIGQMRGFEFSESYLKKIEKMLDIILYLTTPAGTVPQIGDNDDGRLLILSGYPDWPRHDYRYLLGIGSVLFNRADFKAACESCPEEVFWLFGKEGVEKFKSIVPDQSPIQTRSFSDAGLYVIRNDEKKDYALIKAGNPMPMAPRAHCHNDALSLELWVNGIPVLIDPGTFCYSPEIDKRNYFRSTLMHNTVTVNNEEINPLCNDVFYLNWQTNFTCKDWSILPEEIRFIGEHDAFEDRFGIIIRRTVLYNRQKSSWSIIDEIVGDKLSNLNITSNWILDPDMNFQNNSSKNIWSGSNNIYFQFNDCNNVPITPVYHSPQYGILSDTSAISVNINADKNKTGRSRLTIWKRKQIN